METDIERLQGTWDIVELEVEGQKMPGAASMGSKIIIDGNHFTTIAMGATYDGTLEVDAARTPKTFNLNFTAGPEAGNRSLGIYELEGDTWRICLTLTGSVRPAKFATAPKSGLALETLKRAASVQAGASPATSEVQYASVPELEGEWSTVECVRDGVPLQASLLRHGKRVDTGNEVTVSFGPQVFFKAGYTVDTTQTPRTIDFIHAAGATAGQRQLGIYEVDGKTLKVCYGPPGQPRPEEYASTPGDGRTMAVWKRVK